MHLEALLEHGSYVMWMNGQVYCDLKKFVHLLSGREGNSSRLAYDMISYAHLSTS